MAEGEAVSRGENSRKSCFSTSLNVVFWRILMRSEVTKARLLKLMNRVTGEEDELINDCVQLIRYIRIDRDGLGTL